MVTAAFPRNYSSSFEIQAWLSLVEKVAEGFSAEVVIQWDALRWLSVMRWLDV